MVELVKCLFSCILADKQNIYKYRKVQYKTNSTMYPIQV